jgi:hypothetical protein
MAGLGGPDLAIGAKLIKFAMGCKRYAYLHHLQSDGV